MLRLSNGAILVVGGSPPPGPWLGGCFSLLVLTAKQYQPPAGSFPGVRVLHVPLSDNGGPLNTDEQRAAIRASGVVAQYLARGKNVVVTCQMGLNRSALVSSLALVRLGVDRASAVRALRSIRFGALNNRYFEHMVLGA